MIPKKPSFYMSFSITFGVDLQDYLLMEIPDISAGDIQIRQLNIPAIPTWIGDTPQSLQIAAPVTVTIGSPIVDIPGCVESHPDAGKNKKLAEEDPNGVQTYCDGTVPSFYPINYEPEQLILTKPEQKACLLYTSPSPRDKRQSRMPSSA